MRHNWRASLKKFRRLKVLLIQSFLSDIGKFSTLSFCEFFVFFFSLKTSFYYDFRMMHV